MLQGKRIRNVSERMTRARSPHPADATLSQSIHGEQNSFERKVSFRQSTQHLPVAVSVMTLSTLRFARLPERHKNDHVAPKPLGKTCFLHTDGTFFS